MLWGAVLAVLGLFVRDLIKQKELLDENDALQGVGPYPDPEGRVQESDI